MSIESIVNRILAEAHEQGSQVLKEADVKIINIVENAKKQADVIQEDFKKRAETDSILLKDRGASVAELEARKMKLAAKQDVISRCFDLALDRLAHLDEPEYLDLLSSAILAIGTKGGELLLNGKDRKTIGGKLIRRVNSCVGEAEALILSEDTIDARGGFVLRKGSMEVNFTLEAMVGGIREVVTPRVVEALFDQ